MNRYEVILRDNKGQSWEGVLLAQDTDQLLRQVADNRGTLLKIKEVSLAPLGAKPRLYPRVAVSGEWSRVIAKVSADLPSPRSGHR